MESSRPSGKLILHISFDRFTTTFTGSKLDTIPRDQVGSNKPDLCDGEVFSDTARVT